VAPLAAISLDYCRATLFPSWLLRARYYGSVTVVGAVAYYQSLGGAAWLRAVVTLIYRPSDLAAICALLDLKLC
jgi:hypothetical protein